MSVEVSVIVPALSAPGPVARAVQAALEQALQAIEVLVVDDGERVAAVDAAVRAAGGDPRVRLVRAARAPTPAAARNAAFRAAQGRWIAPLEPGDEIAPDRLVRLTALGEACCADIVADNIAILAPIGRGRERYLMRRRPNAPARRIGLAEFVRCEAPLSRKPSLAALKPLLRADFVRRWRLRYDEALPMGAEFCFFAEALARGARLFVSPLPGYRQHDAIDPPRPAMGNPFAPLLGADDAFRRRHAGALDRAAIAALDERRRALEAASAIAELTAALAARRYGRAARFLIDRPAAAMRFVSPAARRTVALAAGAVVRP